MSNPSDWLANLPVYTCPFCSKRTIFKEGCGECSQKLSDTEEIEDIRSELEEIRREENSLQERRSRLDSRLQDLEKRYNLDQSQNET